LNTFNYEQGTLGSEGCQEFFERVQKNFSEANVGLLSAEPAEQVAA
jgi:hypothetical protein